MPEHISPPGSDNPTGPLKCGSMIRVRPIGDPERDLMYHGWFAVILRVVGGKALVDSDEYTRRTGEIQAVSFARWFPLGELELIGDAPRVR